MVFPYRQLLDPYEATNPSAESPLAGMYAGLEQPRTPFSPLNQEQFGQYQQLEDQKQNQGFLGWLLGSLDKPARAVRAAVGGLTGNKFNPSELLSWVPFSDTFGLTNPSNQTTIRNLLGKEGEHAQSFWSWDNLGDIVGSMALDPLAWLPMASGVKAGLTAARGTQAASGAAPAMRIFGSNISRGTFTPEALTMGKVGILPQSERALFAGADAGNLISGMDVLQGGGYGVRVNSPLADALRKTTPALQSEIDPILGRIAAGETVPLQGVTRIPFTDTVIGAQPGLPRTLAQSVLFPFAGVPGFSGAASDLWRESMRFAPGISGLRSLFSGPTGGSRLKSGQQIHEFLERPGQQVRRIEAQGQHWTAMDALERAGVTPDILNRNDVETWVRNFGEGWPSGAAPTSFLNQQQVAALQQEAPGALRFLDDQLSAANRQGMNFTRIPNYSPARAEGQAGYPAATIMPHTGGVSPATMQRTFLDEYGLSTDIKRQLTADPQLVGAGSLYTRDPRAAMAHIADQYGGAAGTGRVLPGTEQNVAYALRDAPRSMTESAAERGMYPHSFFEDSLHAGIDNAKMLAGNETIHKTAALYAIPMDQIPAHLQNDTRSLGWYLDQFSDGARGTLNNPQGQQYLAEMMTKYHGRQFTPDDLVHWGVPIDMVQGVKEAHAAMLDPTMHGVGTRLFDAFHNWFKSGVTQLWPLYHITNAIGGVFNNLMTGTYDPTATGILKLFTPYAYAKKMESNGVIDGLAAKLGLNISDAEASTQLHQRLLSHNIFQPRIRSLQEAVGVFGDETASQLLQPHHAGFYMGDYPMTAADWVQPWKIRGVASSEGDSLLQALRNRDLQGTSLGIASRTEWAPARIGEAFSSRSDSLNRAAHYISKELQGMTPDQAWASTLASQYDYSALTPFEKNFMRRVVPFYCVPDDSKILTRDGWKTCDEVAIGEDVLTYNQAKDQLEWQPCLAVNVFDHNESLMTFQTKRGRNFRFTANHRWPVRRSGNTIKRPYGTYVYEDKTEVVEGKDLKEWHGFIQAAAFFGQESILTPTQARLLGWILTDGYHRWRGNHCEAVIYQHPTKYLLEVCAVAGGKPRKPHPDTGTVCVPVLKERKEEIQQFFDKDNLIKIVTRLSRDAAKAMFDAMYKAEGNSVNIAKAGEHFAQEHEGVLDAFRILALLLGRSTHLSGRGCYLCKSRFINISNGKIGWQFYKGRVWCPTTANGTWVMRQGDEIVVTGNSWSKLNLGFWANMLKEQPGTVGVLARAEEGQRQTQDYTPEWMRGGFSIPLGATSRWTDPLSGRQEDRQQFLTLPRFPYQEIAAKLPAFGPGDLAEFGRDITQDVSPIVRGIIRGIGAATGGGDLGLGLSRGQREAREINPRVDPTLRTLMEYSPATRGFSSFMRGMENVRMGMTPTEATLAELAPFHVRMIDPTEQRRLEEKRLLGAILRQNPNMQEVAGHYSIKPERLYDVMPRQDLSPAENTGRDEFMLRMRAHETMANIAEVEAARRRIEDLGRGRELIGLQGEALNRQGYQERVLQQLLRQLYRETYRQSYFNPYTGQDYRSAIPPP